MSNAATQIHQHLGVESALYKKKVQGGNWNELVHQLEPSIRDQIAASADSVAQARIAVIKAGMMDNDFDTLSTLVLRDLNDFSDRYCDIVQERGGREGPTNSIDEFTEYMALGSRLTAIFDDLHVVTGHNLFLVHEYHAKAIDYLASLEKKDNEIESEETTSESENIEDTAAVVSDMSGDEVNDSQTKEEEQK